MSYSSEVLADTPLAYYRLGSNANDSSGNGHNGTATSVTFGGAGALTDGDPSAAFDGTASRIYTSSFNPWSGSVTIEAWVKTTAYASGSNKRIVGCDGSNNASFFITTAGNIDFTYNGLGIAVWSGFWSTIGDGVWAHVVCAFDPVTLSNCHLYLNGIDLGNPGSTGAYGTVGNFTIGAGNSTPAGFFPGSLDEVAIYSGLLSKSRVQAHFAAGSPYSGKVASLGPALWYRLNDAAGTIKDTSGNARHGTANETFTNRTTGLVTSDPDTALRFNGASDASSGGYVIADSYAPFPPNAQRTVATLVTVKSNQNHIVNLFCDYNSTSGNQSMVLEFVGGTNGPSSLRWYGDVSVQFPNFQSWNYDFAIGQRYHIVLRIDDTASTLAGQLCLFINGVKFGTPNDATGWGVQHFHTGTTRPFQFGRRSGAGNTEYIDGVFDEMAIFERLLTDQEVADLAVAAGAVTRTGAGAMAGTGTVSATGVRTRLGAAALAGTGAVSATGLHTAIGSGALSGTGAIAASGLLTAFGSAALTGTGSLVATGFSPAEHWSPSSDLQWDEDIETQWLETAESRW